MEYLIQILIAAATIAAASYATYRLNISRDIIWRRRQKAEELFRAAEVADVLVSRAFRQQYEMSQVATRVAAHEEDLEAKIVDLKTWVGLYFPELRNQLLAVVSAYVNAVEALATLHACRPEDRAACFEQADLAVHSLRDGLNVFKAGVLKAAGEARPQEARRPIVQKLLPQRQAEPFMVR